MDFLEACRKFISIDSSPSHGNYEVACVAADFCRSLGLHVELQHETLNGIEQANVIARPLSVVPNEELLLQTHLDTVDPGAYALWTRTGANPFHASLYQGAIYGLGAADVKLDFLCKLQAAASFQDVSWRTPYVLVGTFGEELGMSGAIKLIRKKKINAKMALVGEPTEMRLVSAGKGIASVEIELPFSEEEKEYREHHNTQESTSTQSKIFVGKAAHSSVPQWGDSAIVKMLEYLTKLPDGLAVMELEGGVNANTVPAHAVLEVDTAPGLVTTINRKLQVIMAAIGQVEAQFQAYPDPSFTPAEPTLNLGMIRTFTDFIRLNGCCRLPPSVTQEVYEGWMSQLRQACESVGAVFRITDYKPPFRTSEEGRLVRVCHEELRKWGLSAASQTQAVTNEANVLSRFGIECVTIGPGRGVGNSHAPNENVTIEQLESATQFYRGVIERVCL